MKDFDVITHNSRYGQTQGESLEKAGKLILSHPYTQNDAKKKKRKKSNAFNSPMTKKNPERSPKKNKIFHK